MAEKPVNTSNYTDKEKDGLIKREIARLRKAYAPLGRDGLAAMKSLIDEAAFMAVTLMDLRKTINRDGVISTYQNGENQWGTKKSPEVEIYNTMIKNHMSIIKQLQDLIPDGATVRDDGFDLFASERDD